MSYDVPINDNSEMTIGNLLSDDFDTAEHVIWGITYSEFLSLLNKTLSESKYPDYVYNNNGKIGHLIFGWGSCSGCDALQACSGYDSLQELCNELESDIKWFDDAKETLVWFKLHDWQGDFIWHDINGMKYVEKAISYLSELAGEEE